MALSTGIVAMLLAVLATGGAWLATGSFSVWLFLGLGLVIFAAILILRLLARRSHRGTTQTDHSIPGG